MLDAFDSAMSELRDRKLQAHQTFFRGVESLVREFGAEMTANAQRVLDEVATNLASSTSGLDDKGGATIDPDATVEEKRSLLPSHLGSLPDEVVHLVFQPEELIAVSGACFDMLVARLNDAEDVAEKWEQGRCNGAVNGERQREAERNRVGVREVEAMRTACDLVIREQLERAMDDVVAAEGEEFVKEWLLDSVRDVVEASLPT
jgi:hypothetical protein